MGSRSSRLEHSLKVVLRETSGYGGGLLLTFYADLTLQGGSGLKIMKADLTIRLLTYRRSISIRRNRVRIQMDAAAEP